MGGMKHSAFCFRCTSDSRPHVAATPKVRTATATQLPRQNISSTRLLSVNASVGVRLISASLFDWHQCSGRSTCRGPSWLAVLRFVMQHLCVALDVFTNLGGAGCERGRRGWWWWSWWWGRGSWVHRQWHICKSWKLRFSSSGVLPLRFHSRETEKRRHICQWYHSSSSLSEKNNSKTTRATAETTARVRTRMPLNEQTNDRPSCLVFKPPNPTLNTRENQPCNLLVPFSTIGPRPGRPVTGET